jgi:hypothetical protein
MNEGSMNNDERKQSADRWLDAALERYSDAEPRPGFETRLLASVAAERESKAPRRQIWMWAAVAAAAVVVVLALTVSRISRQTPATPMVANSHQRQPSPAPEPHPEVRANAATANANAPTPGERQLVASRPLHRTRPVIVASANRQEHGEVIRRPQFPTPAPLSEQERLLLAYVQSTPKHELESVIAQKQAFEQEFDKLGVPEEQEKSDR